MKPNPIITVRLYPKRYMLIERHELNEAGNICASHILDISGEWVDENSASNVELRPIVAFHNDTNTLRELIAELQEAVDALDKVPHLDYEEQTNAA